MLDYAAYTASIRRSYVLQDPGLAGVIGSAVPAAWQGWLNGRLADVGEVAATRWADWAQTANENPPQLRMIQRNGERIDAVEVHPAYDNLAREAYEAGVVWPRFNDVEGRGQAPWATVLLLGYVMSQAEQGFFCPVCLSAGTAWLLERFADPALKAQFLPKVAAPNFADMFEGAMFLTERAGGSDVGAIETTAKAYSDGTWRLTGDKWFASNGGRAKAMMVLARPEGAPAGTRGLGLFLVPWTRNDGTRNGVHIDRLKDKLGTRSMPSTELRFVDAEAYPVGPVDSGFLAMAEMLNLSRLYNAVASVGNMRRVLNEAIAYLQARQAFGNTVANYPMVRAQLIALTVEQEANLWIVGETARLLDAQEAGLASATHIAALRVLTPIVKYHTGRVSVDMASACAELLGGNGYIEEWPIARFLRDAQVLPIWEGTTNILVLDVLRATTPRQGESGADRGGFALLTMLRDELASPVPAALGPWHGTLAARLGDLGHQLTAIMALDEASRPLHAKPWADGVLRAMQGVLLLRAAVNGLAGGQGRPIAVLGAFMHRHFGPTGWQARLDGPAPDTAYGTIVRGEPCAAAIALATMRAAQAV